MEIQPPTGYQCRCTLYPIKWATFCCRGCREAFQFREDVGMSKDGEIS